MSFYERNRTSSETTITTERSCPVSKPSNNAVYKPRMNARNPIKKNKLDKTSGVLIWFEGLGCCCNILSHISLGDDMDEISFLEEVRYRFYLSREAAEAKIELISENNQSVEWTISSKQGDETGWPSYRTGLFEKKDGIAICDGVYAVVSCLDLYSISCEDLQSACSRKGENRERREGKRRGRWVRRRRFI
jgi:hypothetical protein